MPEHAKKQKGSAFATVLSFCTPAGGRTLDTLIKSQVLYQLSYKRIIVVVSFCFVRLQGVEPWTP